MATVQINLPDELAQNAQQAGLLTPEALEVMLREQLRKQANDALQTMWHRAPEQLTSAQEQLIDEAVEAVRNENRKRTAS